jgi:hypothetical protein
MTIKPRHQIIFLSCALAVVTLMLICAIYPGHSAVRVFLQARNPPGRSPLQVQIQGQVTGPQDGLFYKWFSNSGECDPQVSDKPETLFQFGENMYRDHVVMEVWRDNRRIAQAGIDVTMDAERLHSEAQHPGNVFIQITNVPPYDENGGPETHATIGGMVSGAFTTNYNILIYTRAADTWFIQPITGPRCRVPIASDGTWTNWTHLGSSYAAIVVQPEYCASSRLDILPSVGGPVLARAVVEGVKK